MRKKKTKEQTKLLENEYLKNPNWTRAYMKVLTTKIGLSQGQIYKWHWDQKKRENLDNISL
jgi:Homeodomain